MRRIMVRNAIAGLCHNAGRARTSMASSHLRQLCACAAAAILLAVRPSAQAVVVMRDAVDSGARGATSLPALSADAQRLIDQWKQNQANVVEQLRFLQQTYRDNGRAEDAAAIAAQVRIIQRPLPVAGGVQSSPFGPQKGSFRFVSVSLVRPQRSSSLASYRDLVGQSIVIPVVGTTSDGSVWGSDVYTDDSSPAVAAVHAGILAPGEFGFVKITLLPGQARYDGAPRNGVASQNYGAFEGSFRIEPAAEGIVRLPGGEDASRIVGLSTLRGHPGASFVVEVVGAGSASGSVWGTDVYTDDSSLAAATVHAGLLKPGETGLIRVTIERGRDRYTGSPRNGVTSLNFGTYTGSYRIERTR